MEITKAREFIDDQIVLKPKRWKGVRNISVDEIAELMEDYHRYSLKNLGVIGDVSQQYELLIKCLIEWECSDEPEDLKAFKDWINERPHLIGLNNMKDPRGYFESKGYTFETSQRMIYMAMFDFAKEYAEYYYKEMTKND